MSKAEQILNCVQEKYATCESYTDDGDVINKWNPDAPPHQRQTDSKPFRIRLKRPDKFYYHFQKRGVGPEGEWRKYVIWLNQGQAMRWWSIESKTVEDKDLSLAIAGGHGVSHGSSSMTPRLLMPNISGRTLKQEFGDASIEEDIFNETKCITFSAINSRGHHTQIWIRQSDFAIFQYEDRLKETLEDAIHRSNEMLAYYKINPSDDDADSISFYKKELMDLASRKARPLDTLSTMTFNPRFDIDIPDDELTFTPPE